MNLELLVREANLAVTRYEKSIDQIVENNFNKVLTAFRRGRVGESHFQSSTGYGYGDIGRTALEEIFADVFRTEDALVRQQIVSGTHAITLCLFGSLLPGDEMLSIGRPYDTLHQVIGTDRKEPGTLREMGITYREFPLEDDGVDTLKLVASLKPETKLVAIQRSRGYDWRSSLPVKEIGRIVQAVKKARPEMIVFVDNCYGEFVEEKEPSEVGADLIAGSLIKNPGGGIAPGGGYIVGRHDLVTRASYRLTAPGIGKEVGPSLGSSRLFFQGLFSAPHVVREALCGAVFASSIFLNLGLEVSPGPDEVRTDIIQAIKMENPERLLAFCQGIQKYSPVDSFATPEPWDMPGYSDPVVMAAGAFVQGSSIELSADAPMRKPYIVYLQGGTCREHVKAAVTGTIGDLLAKGLL